MLCGCPETLPLPAVQGSLYYIPGVATETADGRLVPPFHQTHSPRTCPSVSVLACGKYCKPF